MKNEGDFAHDFFLQEPQSAKISQDKPLPKAPIKVELQTLYLTSNSQKQILEVLKYIHGSDFTLADASQYKSKNSKLHNQFWLERGNLIIKGACDYSQIDSSKDTPKDRFRMFSITKLKSYGFDENHCIEALDHFNDNFDLALKCLYDKYHNREAPNKIEYIPSADERLQSIHDEKEVLESIYEKNFSEKVKNQVWTLTFKLDFLNNLLLNKKAEEKAPAVINNKKKDVPKCRNFLKGFCKFGQNCRFSHEVEPKKPTISESTNEFTLEIRFFDDDCYPYGAPMILLRASDEVNPLGRLKICRRLIEEADHLALDGVVAVYSVSELLQNAEEIIEYYKNTKVHFINSNESLLKSKQIETIETKNLPTHYNKGTTGGNKVTSNEEIVKDDEKLVKTFLEVRRKHKYKSFLETRQNLPAWNEKNEILRHIRQNNVVVISGETGCGKSTQVPQFILDDWLLNWDGTHVEIICTQPRRLSAIGVAERVAEERIERVGGSIGYQIRLENKISSLTRLNFCTTGILLRRLESDPFLSNITHIIVDEVHERSEESDFLLLILKRLTRIRPNLKIILMSATLNAKLFSEYFDGAPVLNIPGRSFPVDQMYLEDIFEEISNYVLEENSQYARKVKQSIDLELELLESEVQNAPVPSVKVKDENLTLTQLSSRYQGFSPKTCKNIYLSDPEKINLELIESVLEWIVFGKHDYPQEGSILIFLPGIGEISSLYDQLCENPEFSPRNQRFVLLPLHSSLTNEEQAAIFRTPKNGARKIIISTNIAETSITIDDCIFVIDSGKMKEKRFDSNKNMESLEMTWISRANAQQRRGRAGRVCSGLCLHLFTKHRFQYHLLSQPIPELHRVPLEQLVLRIKVLPNFNECSVEDVLGSTLEPPAEENISTAIVRLQNIGALDEELSLTPLGHHLAALPVDVRIGKLMLFGSIFCCLDSALTIAACLSYKSPFVVPFAQKREADAKKKDFAKANSDQITVLYAYKKWQELSNRSAAAARNFTQENYLSYRTLTMIADIKHQLLELLISIGFVPGDVQRSRRSGYDKVANVTGPHMNVNNENNKLLAAVLCASLYPNVIKVLTPEKSFHKSATGAVPRLPKSEELRFKTKSDGYVNIHPSSVNYSVSHFSSPYLVYQEKIRTSRIFVRDTCMIPLLPLALFSGCNLNIEVHSGASVLSLEDGWIMFQTETHEVAEMIKVIRLELNKILEKKISDPCLNLLHNEEGKKIITTIVDIVTTN